VNNSLVYYSFDNGYSWNNIGMATNSDSTHWSISLQEIKSSTMFYYVKAFDEYANSSTSISFDDSIRVIKFNGDVPPEIACKPLPINIPEDISNFQVKVTDINDDLDKNKVKLYYKLGVNEGVNSTSFTAENDSMFNLDLDELNIQDTIYYYVSATDDIGNRSTFPGNCEENMFWSLYSSSTSNSIITDQINQINVYPNPTSDVLYIQSSISIEKEILIKLFDVSGKELFFKQFDRLLKNNTYEIDMSNLDYGVYYLQISNSKMFKVEKVIKN